MRSSAAGSAIGPASPTTRPARGARARRTSCCTETAARGAATEEAVMGLVAQIEDQLARLREKEAGADAPVLRTSTMTHLVWAPPSWLSQARATLAGLQDRHPARTIFLIPEPRRA